MSLTKYLTKLILFALLSYYKHTQAFATFITYLIVVCIDKNIYDF